MKKILLLGFGMLVVSVGYGQRIESYLGNYTGRNANGYIQPLADALPAMLHSGWSPDAQVESGFHLYVGVVVFAALPTPGQKQFEATLTGNSTAQSSTTPVTGSLFGSSQREPTATVPTLFGDSRAVTVPGENGTARIFAGGLATSYLPLAAPQLTLGSLFGTEINVRYFAFDFGRNFGKLDMIGAGIRHNLSQYLHSDKLDLTVAYAEQQFKLSTVLNVRSRQLTLEAGQHGQAFAYYGFISYLMSKTAIHYAYSADADSQIDLSLTNTNSLIVGAGASLTVWKLKLHTTVSYAGSVVAAAGFGLNF